MKVHWTETAEAHLDAIYVYIAQDSKTYALRTVDRITKRSIQIAAFPLSGRKVPEYDLDQIREVFSGPYRIIYYIKPEQIDIIAVIHGSMSVLHVPIGSLPKSHPECGIWLVSLSSCPACRQSFKWDCQAYFSALLKHLRSRHFLHSQWFLLPRS